METPKATGTDPSAAAKTIELPAEPLSTDPEYRALRGLVIESMHNSLENAIQFFGAPREESNYSQAGA